jgi:hypothetical protein
MTTLDDSTPKSFIGGFNESISSSKVLEEEKVILPNKANQ